MGRGHELVEFRKSASITSARSIMITTYSIKRSLQLVSNLIANVNCELERWRLGFLATKSAK